ncbi:MAG: hypothetical protein K9K67_05795 [Bacteriovoracaceae bacterium]|nr:hypothetical protein [Bacteriovoracaceae bacterium]
MEEIRRSYDLSPPILINDRKIVKVVIDPHVDKHSDHINDELILDLVRLLDGRNYSSVKESGNFEYFVSQIRAKNRNYRLVWLLESEEVYIGVITAFKDRGVK